MNLLEAQMMTREALEDPHGEAEELVADLLGDLRALADMGNHDAYLIPAIEGVGAALNRLLGMGQPGRMDQAVLARKIETIVLDAGGSTDNL